MQMWRTQRHKKVYDTFANIGDQNQTKQVMENLYLCTEYVFNVQNFLFLAEKWENALSHP